MGFLAFILHEDIPRQVAPPPENPDNFPNIRAYLSKSRNNNLKTLSQTKRT